MSNLIGGMRERGREGGGEGGRREVEMKREGGMRREGGVREGG